MNRASSKSSSRWTPPWVRRPTAGGNQQLRSQNSRKGEREKNRGEKETIFRRNSKGTDLR